MWCNTKIMTRGNPQHPREKNSTHISNNEFENSSQMGISLKTRKMFSKTPNDYEKTTRSSSQVKYNQKCSVWRFDSFHVMV